MHIYCRMSDKRGLLGSHLCSARSLAKKENSVEDRDQRIWLGIPEEFPASGEMAANSIPGQGIDIFVFALIDHD